MISRTALPDSITSCAVAAVLESAAMRIETPCGDQSMVWRVWGEQGLPVVLLHGGSGSWNHWVRNIAALVAAGRKVFVPDLPGFGDSAKPPVGRDADALPQWVESGLQAMLGAAPCDLVGFSFGAMVAGFLAAQFPQRVRRLALVGAPALAADPKRQLNLKAWRHLSAGPERDAVIAHNLASLMLARADSIDELALGLHLANLERDRLQRRSISRTDVLLRTLPRIRCPVAGIWGELDALYRGRIDSIGPVPLRTLRIFGR